MALPTREDFLAQLQPDPSFANAPPPPDPCPICYEEMPAPVKTACGHLFCQECISHWFEGASNSCPHCRTELFENDAQPTDEDEGEDDPLLQFPNLEHLDLPFEVDDVAVDEILRDFISDRDWRDYNAETYAYIDLELLLPAAAAKITWQKEDHQDRLSLEDVARADWCVVAESIRSTLIEFDGKEILASQFWGALLGSWTLHLTASGRDTSLPEYSDAIQPDRIPGYTVCFKNDLVDVFDVVTAAAQFSYSERDKAGLALPCLPDCVDRFDVGFALDEKLLLEGYRYYQKTYSEVYTIAGSPRAFMRNQVVVEYDHLLHLSMGALYVIKPDSSTSRRNEGLCRNEWSAIAHSVQSILVENDGKILRAGQLWDLFKAESDRELRKRGCARSPKCEEHGLRTTFDGDKRRLFNYVAYTATFSEQQKREDPGKFYFGGMFAFADP